MYETAHVRRVDSITGATGSTSTEDMSMSIRYVFQILMGVLDLCTCTHQTSHLLYTRHTKVGKNKKALVFYPKALMSFLARVTGQLISVL